MKRIISSLLILSVAPLSAASMIKRSPVRIGSNVARAASAKPAGIARSAVSSSSAARLSIGSYIKSKTSTPGKGNSSVSKPSVSEDDLENIEKELDVIREQMDDLDSRTPADASNVYDKTTIDDKLDVIGTRIDELAADQNELPDAADGDGMYLIGVGGGEKLMQKITVEDVYVP